MTGTTRMREGYEGVERREVAAASFLPSCPSSLFHPRESRFSFSLFLRILSLSFSLAVFFYSLS